MTNEAYIIGAVRTPTGKKKGTLGAIHAADLGAHALRALIERTGIDPNHVDDVIFGCVDQIGSQAGDIARTCWLAAGLPDHVPGTTIDRQCGSSQQAVHFAAQAVMSGTQDLVIAGGVQTMNQIPDQRRHGRRPGVRAARSLQRFARLARALRNPGGVAVPCGRDDRREVGHLTPRDGGIRAREQPSRAGRAGAWRVRA